MNAQELIGTARTLVAGDKGLLEMDESNPTSQKRLARLGIPQPENSRCAYRELPSSGTPGRIQGPEGKDKATIDCFQIKFEENAYALESYELSCTSVTGFRREALIAFTRNAIASRDRGSQVSKHFCHILTEGS